MSAKKKVSVDEAPKRGSLWVAAIETERVEDRHNAIKCVGDLVEQIEALDDDHERGPAVGVGLGSPFKAGCSYWMGIRKLITDAIDELDFSDDECARLIGKVYGSCLASLQKSGDLMHQDFVLQCSFFEKHIRRRFEEERSRDSDGEDFDDWWMNVAHGIKEGAKHPRPDLLEIAAGVRKRRDAKKATSSAVREAAATTATDASALAHLGSSKPDIAWPDRKTKDETPDPKSQDNMRAFFNYYGVKPWRDLFAGEIRIDGFKTDHGDNRMSDTVAERLWLMLCDAGCRMDYLLFTRFISAIAASHPRHPIREYLDQLKWDGTSRLDCLFIDYLGAEDTPLNRAYARAFGVSGVRRVRQPGCELYGMPVLEGFEGGEGKSQFAKTLFSVEYHTDALELGAKPKEVIEIATGKWGVEFAELDGLTSVREFSTIKAMQTRTEDRARRAYGRFTSSDPRQFVMIGTTNDGAYLKDRGGLRRFWPITVKPGVLARMLPKLKRDRNQLWAEAAYLEAKDEPHNIPERLWAEAKIEQQNRVIADPVEEWLAPLFEGMPKGFLPSDQIRRAFKDQEFDYDRAARSGVISRLARKLGLDREEKKIPNSRLNARGFLKGGDAGWNTWLEHRGRGFVVDRHLTREEPEEDEGQEPRSAKVVPIGKPEIMRALRIF